MVLRNFFFLLFFVILNSCVHNSEKTSSDPVLPDSAEERGKKIKSADSGSPVTVFTVQKIVNVQDFLSVVKRAVLSKNRSIVLKLIDENYKRTQLKGFFKGDEKRFINDLLCGNDTHKSFRCIDFEEVTKIESGNLKKETTGKGPSGFSVQFFISDLRGTITCEFSIKVLNEDGKQFFFLVGAVG
ncbi:MAG: hypothetical protein JXR95_01065 [Deltaproteobacteria bacterium]|nr:hypothetical protein [Deltaproteobacteria bacterium]